MGFRKKTDMLGKKEASNESTRGKKKNFQGFGGQMQQGEIEVWKLKCLQQVQSHFNMHIMHFLTTSQNTFSNDFEGNTSTIKI